MPPLDGLPTSSIAITNVTARGVLLETVIKKSVLWCWKYIICLDLDFGSLIYFEIVGGARV